MLSTSNPSAARHQHNTRLTQLPTTTAIPPTVRSRLQHREEKLYLIAPTAVCNNLVPILKAERESIFPPFVLDDTWPQASEKERGNGMPHSLRVHLCLSSCCCRCPPECLAARSNFEHPILPFPFLKSSLLCQPNLHLLAVSAFCCTQVVPRFCKTFSYMTSSPIPVAPTNSIVISVKNGKKSKRAKRIGQKSQIGRSKRSNVQDHPSAASSPASSSSVGSPSISLCSSASTPPPAFPSACCLAF